MQSLKGKVALITGAGSGIGRATALRLAKEGASLALCDLNISQLSDCAKVLPGNTESLICQFDVSDSDACTKAVEDSVAQFGRLDTLCNIAGVALCEHFTKISDEDWQRVLNINLTGVFYMCRAAMNALVKNQGSIINMASSAGRTGQAYNSAYCATKAGVIMLTKSLAIEFAADNVRVNAICPGMVDTPLTQNFVFPENADPLLMSRLSPLLEGAQPDEIASLVAYLASSEARFITGAELPIDGGQTAG